jgi:hypothetical protein
VIILKQLEIPEECCSLISEIGEILEPKPPPQKFMEKYIVKSLQ